MKLANIKVGGRYLAKVSGNMVTVRVTELKEVAPCAWSQTAKWRTHIHAVNEATGRKLILRTASRLRAPVEPGQFPPAKPTHLNYAEEAESAERGGALAQAAALWRRAVSICDDADRRATYEAHIRRIEGMIAPAS